jgi:tRNA A-37 threonylcarbamoyl transferase component Bud32
VPDSFATYEVDDFRLAYYRMEAGTPFKITDRTLENLAAAVGVLEEMHRANHIHGDARVDNLVFHGNPRRLVWMDQMVASDQTDNPTLRKLDAVALMKSILPASKHNLIEAAVDQYLSALDTSQLLELLQ